MVLEIYRITLLSNRVLTFRTLSPVLEIYRITLLSNKVGELKGSANGFGDLQNYTTLKQARAGNGKKTVFWRFTELHYSQTLESVGGAYPTVLEIYRITLLSNN